jgi:hypothetical protein
MEPNQEEYQQKVMELALKTLSDFDIREVCLDTLRESYRSRLSIREAADKCVDDTLYWEGAYSS